MKIVLITQNDPFYLGENLDYLMQKLPLFAKVVGCVVSDVSPFGKKGGLIEKARITWRVFGWGFFLRYGFRYLIRKMNPKYRVREVLKKYGIEEVRLEGSINTVGSLSSIGAKKPDLLISIAGNEIFKKPLIELAPKGCLNLHTSLLPRYRGLMPSFWVLKNGETETGVSVFFVDEGIDSGPIVVQKKFPLDGITQEELISGTKRLGMDAIIEAIDKIHSGKVDLIDNDDLKMTYCSFPTKEDVWLFRSNGKRFF